jgi:hypothetical protein
LVVAAPLVAVAVRPAPEVVGRDAVPACARLPRARPDATLEATQRVAQTIELVAEITVPPELLLDLSNPCLDPLNDRADARYLGHHSPSWLTS